MYKPQSAYGQGMPIVRINDFDNTGQVVTQTTSRLWVETREAQEFGLQAHDILIK